VVPDKQAKAYAPLAKRHGVLVLPCPVDGIAATRQFIGKAAKDKFLMLDDDLRFYYRKSVDDWHLYPNTKRHDIAMLLMVESLLDKYAHVCIGPRLFNAKYSSHVPPSGSKPNPEMYPMYEIGRPLRALAYRREPFNACEHGRVAIMEDFDVTLQLLRKGYKNVILTCYAQDQPQTQLPGGCSDYRTHTLHTVNVLKLKKLHNDFVTVVRKKNKTGGTFGTRIEASIKWEKAWNEAIGDIL